MTTPIAVPEYLHWTTRVTGKGPNQKNTGWVLQLQTPLPGSSYPTNLYPRDPSILVYNDIDGVPAMVPHSRTDPGGSTTDWASDLVEVGDVVAVQLRRDTFKINKQDGTPNDPNWATSYFWSLESIAPSTGPVMEASAPPRQAPPPAPAGVPADTPQPLQIAGIVRGHCENVIVQLAIAKLLPGIEAEDGGVDWQVFRTYRDLYFHNVSDVPIEPLPSEDQSMPEPLEEQPMLGLEVNHGSV